MRLTEQTYEQKEAILLFLAWNSQCRGGKKETEVVGLKIRTRKRVAKIFTSHTHFCSRTL